MTRARSCNDESVAIFKIGKQGLLSGAGHTVSSVRGGREDGTYLMSMFACCTAAKAAALTLDASRPEGSAQTRHIWQLAG